MISLEQGQPIRFGESSGIARDPDSGGVRVVTDVTDETELLVHDAHRDDPTTAFALSRLTDAGVLHRAPIGIFRDVSRPSYDDQARAQIRTARDAQSDDATALEALVSGGDTWTVV